jgi:toxin ParE1/3/4
MPTRFEVSYTRSAEQDIEEIWSFIAEDSPDNATRFIHQLEKQIATLERLPERCSLISENKSMNSRYRHLIYRKYRTIFRVLGRRVFVVRIIHGARLLNASFFESTRELED